jgi:hypothetical protein
VYEAGFVATVSSSKIIIYHKGYNGQQTGEGGYCPALEAGVSCGAGFMPPSLLSVDRFFL